MRQTECTSPSVNSLRCSSSVRLARRSSPTSAQPSRSGSAIPAAAGVATAPRRRASSCAMDSTYLIDDRVDRIAVGEVNQQALFGRVAAIVHHGGAGTTMTAARAGAPRVVVPQMADQPY
jgi:vancomycin aglycone glucosyltransferase